MIAGYGNAVIGLKLNDSIGTVVSAITIDHCF